MPDSPNTVALQVTPADIPLIWMVETGEAGGSPEEGVDQLVLFPGKRSTSTIHLHNTSDRPLHLTLAIKGNFPLDWLVIEETWQPSDPLGQEVRSPTITVESDQELGQLLIFEVPQDFFEVQTALQDQEHLTLNYTGELMLYAKPSPQAALQLVGYRYLHLKIRPLRSYIDFLPAIYQDSDFLRRFLSIIEQSFNPVVETTEALWAYLDPLTAPEAMLPFLAQWVAWPLNSRWPLKYQRRLIRHAAELYRWRGSHYGLQLMLHLGTGLPQDDQHIEIIEAREVDFVLGDVTYGEGPMLGGGRPFHFFVALRPETPEQFAAIDEALVREVIEQEKPAFCTYDLNITTPVKT